MLTTMHMRNDITGPAPVVRSYVSSPLASLLTLTLPLTAGLLLPMRQLLRVM